MSVTLEGKTIGPYQLIKIIGRGGMGVIYRARQANVERDVAIKLIDMKYAQYPSIKAFFKQEASFIARLQHPHILPVYDVGMSNKQPYIAMALMTGGSLVDHITAHPRGLPVDEVIRITKQLASALEHAHNQGIVHCDVKPGNILLDQQHNAYLSDFGIAQAAGLTADATCGTDLYMAPEMARGGQHTEPSSDIYSFAVLVYEMLTAHLPQQQPMMYSGTAYKTSSPIDVTVWRPGMPRGVNVVLRQALSEQPTSRPRSALAFAKSLQFACQQTTKGIEDFKLPEELSRNGGKVVKPEKSAVPKKPEEFDLFAQKAAERHALVADDVTEALSKPQTPPPGGVVRKQKVPKSSRMPTRVNIKNRRKSVPPVPKITLYLIYASLIILLLVMYALVMISLANAPG